MNPRPSVSAVVLNYNGKRFLADCLRALQALAYPADRLAIVLADNASTDGSVALVRERFPDVTIHAFDRNLGFAGGNNRAIEKADTEYVFTINNDTIVAPDCLDLLMDACTDGADCAGAHNVSWDGEKTLFCGGTINFFGTGLSKAVAPDDGRPFPARFPCGCGMLIRRDLFLETGGFDEDFYMYQEDVDFGWRLNLYGRKVVIVPRATIRHYEGGSTRLTPGLFQKAVSIRNPMLAMVKNYDDANLRKALPAALVLLLSRVMFHLGVEGYDAASLAAFEERLAAATPGDRESVTMAMANLAALHGFLALLDRALAKRERIQARRVVSDDEIARAFHVDLGYGEYLLESNFGVPLLRVLEYFDLGNLFDPARIDSESLERLGLLDMRIAQLSTRVQRAERELAAIRRSRAWRLVSRLFGVMRRLGIR